MRVSLLTQALEPRQITRVEAAKYARAAFDMGVRYIGGCCGFEAYHIRAMAEELASERLGQMPEGSAKSDFDFSAAKRRAKTFAQGYGSKLTFSKFEC